MNKFRNSSFLLLTSIIWGLAFIAQSVGMDYIKPFTFNGIRSLIGGVVLIPLVFILRCRANRRGELQKENKKVLITGGICCGVILFIASTLQQYALVDTSPGKAGFMTALYIVIVPMIGGFTGKKTGIKLIIAVIASLIGLYFLCFDGEKFTLAPGDIYLILAATMFSIHILVIDYFSPKADGVAMSCIQFIICGLLSVLPIILFEKPELSAIIDTKAAILYAGVMSCGVAYTLQIVGQKGVNPTLASLILSLESVFALLGEFVYSKITGNPSTLSHREIFGCAIVFFAIILAQLPDKRKT